MLPEIETSDPEVLPAGVDPQAVYKAVDKIRATKTINDFFDIDAKRSSGFIIPPSE